MSFFRSLQKNMRAHHLITFVGIFVLALAIMQYSGRKNTFSDGFGSGRQRNSVPVTNPNVLPGVAVAAEPLGQNEVYANVPNGATTSTYGLPPVSRPNTNYDPSELLPKDANSQWAQLNPAGNADFKNVNLLKAGHLIGIDTVGNTLRNANLQVRSEPPNPTNNVSPWLNTTISPDLMRRPLEIGNNENCQ